MAARAQLYSPRGKIVLASSFEGVLNNGARECAFVSLNALERLRGRTDDAGRAFAARQSFFGKMLSPEEFRKDEKVRDSTVVKAFLLLRPLVEVAEDYLTVLQIIQANHKDAELLVETGTQGLHKLFVEEFRKRKAESAAEREEFRKAFYDERRERQAADCKAWLSLQKPFAGTVDEFRVLVRAETGAIAEVGTHETVSLIELGDGGAVMERDDAPSKIVRSGEGGYVASFVTSKDEESTWQLCNAWAREGWMGREDVRVGAQMLSGLSPCIVRREGIVGQESVPSRDKVEQMKVIAGREGVPYSHVWRVNDRVDVKQQRELAAAGFKYQFVITDGYSLPWDVEAAKSDPFVHVVERDNFAVTISGLAQQWGF